jgi:hypothetical protein
MQQVDTMNVGSFFVVNVQNPVSKSSILVYQLEWSKSYARAQRWREEVELLKEEMRRTLKFLDWKSSLWTSKSLMSDRSALASLNEGLNAYAFRQAYVFMSLHDNFLSLWQGLKVLSNTFNHLTPVSVETEELMEGIEGGDAEFE